MARNDFSLEAGERVAVPTGLAVEIPDGHAGLVVPRSGIARRHGVTLVNSPGLVDSGYRGEIEVLLVNLGSEPVSFRRGERIAQLVIVPVAAVDWLVGESLSPSERGAGGFGSTGR
jgi:dUTP pyrophosphatase